MKKLLLIILYFSFSCPIVKAAKVECTPEAAQQLAKIIYKEVGSTVSDDYNEDAFVKFVTASVILNNATTKNGSTIYQQLYNLTNSNYANYSSYKNKSFQNVVPASHQAKMLYIAEMVLNGNFNVPKEMNLQASKSIVERYAYKGNAWYSVKNVYFGHEKALSNTSVLGKSVSMNPEDYLDLAGTLLSKGYSNYTVSNVCSNHNNSNNSNNNGNSTINSNNGLISNNNSNNILGTNKENNVNDLKVNICEDPGVLRAIYILKVIVTIVKIIVPILIILLAIRDLMKAILNNDDKKIKDAIRLIIVRFFVGVFIFFIPTIITTFLSALGNLYDYNDINDCIKNANLEKIKYYDKTK